MAGGNENQMRGNEYDDRTKENYQHNTNYYNYVDKASFEGYNVATTNPGTFLLLLTVMSCIACFAVMGLFVAYRKSKRDHEDEEAGTNYERHDEAPNLTSSEFVSEAPLPRSIEVKSHPRPGTAKITKGTAKITTRKGTAKAHVHIRGNVNVKSDRRPSPAKVRIQVTTPSPAWHETAAIIVDTSALQRTRRGRGKKRYTSESLRNLASITAERMEFTNNVDLKVHTDTENKNARPSTSPDSNYARPSSAESNGKLAFEDLAFYLFTKNRPKSPPNKSLLEEDFLDDHSISSTSTYSSFIGDETMWIEMKKIFKWASPWTLQAIVSYGSDMTTIIMISHFMGLRAMICYSHVWYITGMTHILLSAWYSAIYKHLNHSCALETVEGYHSAGHLTRIGIVGNFLLSIPISILTVIFMPNMMNLLGYDGAIVVLSQQYAVVVIINYLLSSTSELLYCILDLEGYAKFTAIFEFWESGLGLLCDFVFIVCFSPSLVALGIFHLIFELASTFVYYGIVWSRGWFNGYTGGLMSPIESWWTPQLKSIASMMIPLIGGEIIGNIESIVLTIFAAYQGSAEAATWILMSYVWSFVELIPSCFADAASVRVVRHLSKSRVEFAQRLCFYSIKVGAFLSVICSVVLFCGGRLFVWCLSLDETLEQMLLEIIPYIVICQPFVSVGTVVWGFLDALHIYKQATYVSAVITIVFILPYAAMMTYYYNYNIEGLASAMCIGYTAMGVASIGIFINADWDRAVRKAQIV